jgi:hypothetical protein
MTCAALMALAIAHGVRVESRSGNQATERQGPDPEKDPRLRSGLGHLARVLGRGPVRPGRGLDCYCLWSLERVAVGLGLNTIGKKDWYAWGAEGLLASQGADGTWQTGYGPVVDTSFALLFLKRSNLATDLTANIAGKVKDPGQVVLRSGGLGGEALSGGRPTGREAAPPPERPRPRNEGPPPAPPAPPAPKDSNASRLARAVAGAPPGRQEKLLEEMRDGKGVEYTEALASAIARLDGDARRKARQALAERLTRMKPATLVGYLGDEDAEIRRAAALACAMKDDKKLIPDVIRALGDREPLVRRAAHAALKELSGRDLGPDAAAWRAWWDQERRK